MDWNVNQNKPFVSGPDNSFSYLYNYNYENYPGEEIKHKMFRQGGQHGVIPVPIEVPMMEMNNYNNNNNIQELKNKRLTSEQLRLLESIFEEEKTLDPYRRMQLAQQLGLPPRQIAVWFQNRRARWKIKQLERQFDLVSREKQKLQEEVVALRAMLKEHTSKKTEIPGEETDESSSVANRTSHNNKSHQANFSHNQIGDENCVLNADDYNPANVMPSPFNYWPIFPSYPSI